VPSKVSKKVVRNQWMLAVAVSFLIIVSAAAVQVTIGMSLTAANQPALGGTTGTRMTIVDTISQMAGTVLKDLISPFTGGLGSTGLQPVGGGTGSGTGGLPPSGGGIGGGQPPIVRKLTPENTDAACSDGMDNNFNFLIDCQDPDCDNKACTSAMVGCPPGTSGGGPSKVCGGRLCNQINYVCKETSCGDNIDNNNNGRIDCADDDCAGQVCSVTGCPLGAVGAITYTCTAFGCDPTNNQCSETSCADGSDNDADGLTDCADPDCDRVGICEYGKELNCNDVADNDGDGFANCMDVDCDKVANCEYGTELTCNDGFDNDYDYDTDAYDMDCPSPDLVPIGVNRSTTQSGYSYKLIVKNQGDADAGKFLSVMLLNVSRINDGGKEIGIDDPDIRICWMDSLKAGATGYCTNETAIKTSAVLVATNVFNQVTEGRDKNGNNMGLFNVTIK